MQFYINKSVVISQVISRLEQYLKLVISHIDNLEDNDAVYSIDEFTEGSWTGVGIDFNPNTVLKVDFIEIASEISSFTQHAVITDLPKEHPRHNDPFCWCMINPDGKKFLISEKTDDLDRNGLVLDETTIRPID